MHWKDELAAKIDALKDGDWEPEVVIVPDRNAKLSRIRRAFVKVGIDSLALSRIVADLGRVNEKPIGKAPRGTVLLGGIDTDGDGAYSAAFHVRSRFTWNHFYRIEKNGFAELRGKNGSLPYPYSDFDF